MDITQLKSPPAQLDVELKVVKDNSGSSSQTKDSGNVADKVAKLQAEAALQKKKAEPSTEQMTEKLTKQVRKMNEFVQNIQRDLKFSVDDDSGKTVVKVFNTHTKELVRQIPSEEALLLAERIKENRDETSGLILKVEV
ncbi:MAG: flagellar protein FlaG [Gammaproteobacteria bacterium]|nr:flagellar protein FlaG [Gammaproteobacteria bacterium]